METIKVKLGREEKKLLRDLNDSLGKIENKLEEIRDCVFEISQP